VRVLVGGLMIMSDGLWLMGGTHYSVMTMGGGYFFEAKISSFI
jgi:hypothetical protein